MSALNLPTLEQSGLTDALPELLKIRQGLILVGGPAAAGKTSTLSVLGRQFLALQDERKVVSVRVGDNDVVPGLDEVYTDELTDDFIDTFTKPQVVILDDIADRHSALFAVDLALTGNLVIASRHEAMPWETPWKAFSEFVAFAFGRALSGIYGIDDLCGASIKQRSVQGADGLSRVVPEIAYGDELRRRVEYVVQYGN